MKSLVLSLVRMARVSVTSHAGVCRSAPVGHVGNTPRTLEKKWHRGATIAIEPPPVARRFAAAHLSLRFDVTSFAELGLCEPLLRALAHEGYSTPTPIQAQAIPALLTGRDLLGIAQTGTGKTAAFALPVLQRLAARRPEPGKKRPIRALVLSPTRELAAQIAERASAYGNGMDLWVEVIFGGVNPRPQAEKLQRGVDMLVATPGRLLDLIGQGFVDLSRVEYFVLDEADRMLDMGFFPDVRRVLRMLPAQRQNLLFSATMPAEIAELAGSFLKEPLRIEVTPPATTVERIDQWVAYVNKGDKKRLLEHLLHTPGVERTLVFTRTKHGANKVVQDLERSGWRAAAIHGNKSQNARTAALEGFRGGTIPVLVATDIAARGIDVDQVTHVINFDLPNEPESYVHRIGRTARAGRDGIAISFCDVEEGEYLRDILRKTGADIDPLMDQPFHSEDAERAAANWIRRTSGPRPPGTPNQLHREQRPAGHAHRPAGHGGQRPQGQQAQGGQRPQGQQAQGGQRPQGHGDARPAGGNNPRRRRWRGGSGGGAQRPA
jgi:ATP-dependent RNA helicase RhlE